MLSSNRSGPSHEEHDLRRFGNARNFQIVSGGVDPIGILGQCRLERLVGTNRTAGANAGNRDLDRRWVRLRRRTTRYAWNRDLGCLTAPKLSSRKPLAPTRRAMDAPRAFPARSATAILSERDPSRCRQPRSSKRLQAKCHTPPSVQPTSKALFLQALSRSDRPYRPPRSSSDARRRTLAGRTAYSASRFDSNARPRSHLECMP